MALTDLSAQSAPYISDDGTATASFTEQTLPKNTRTVTIEASGAIEYGYDDSGRGFPLAANTKLEIQVGGELSDPVGARITSLYLKGGSGGETIYLDCSPFRKGG